MKDTNDLDGNTISNNCGENKFNCEQYHTLHWKLHKKCFSKYQATHIYKLCDYFLVIVHLHNLHYRPMFLYERVFFLQISIAALRLSKRKGNFLSITVRSIYLQFLYIICIRKTQDRRRLNVYKCDFWNLFWIITNNIFKWFERVWCISATGGPHLSRHHRRQSCYNGHKNQSFYLIALSGGSGTKSRLEEYYFKSIYSCVCFFTTVGF